MIKFLKILWNFLNSKVFLYIIVALIAIWLINTCSNNKDLKRDKIINEQNIAALNDSIKMEKKKNGEIKASITSYVSSLDELKKLNRDLYNDVKQQKNDIISLNKTLIRLEQDTKSLSEHVTKINKIPNKVDDSTYTIDWELRYNWDKSGNVDIDTINSDINKRTKNYDIYKGTTKIKLSFDGNVIKIMQNKIYLDLPIDSIINKNIIYNSLTVNNLGTDILSRRTQIDLKFGHEVVDKKIKFFVESKYPGFSVESMSGYFIDPTESKEIKQLMKKPQWFPGYWSLGLGASSGYNILTGKPYLGLGVNVSYTLYQW